MTNMLKKVFNWSEVHLSEVTSYKIHTLVYVLLLPCMKKKERKKRERNPIYNRFFNKVVVIVFLFTGL